VRRTWLFGSLDALKVVSRGKSAIVERVWFFGRDWLAVVLAAL
jgi:hypothetical protein